ncbi:MAG: hypothetical protein A2V70_00865 [Planctomycetes bacterium RBG_13_63_9]|nr:MAG: hypothetical protein A2V70_00865 [Planctomycetes bacterium RBG_13_63_9]
MATPRRALAQTVARRTASTENKSLNESKGLAAIDAAARNGKYLFVYFWKANDKQSQAMYGVFQSAMKKWVESTDSIAINMGAPSEKPVVDKFGVSRAPMPLVLALAPNGAITKGFPIKFDENQLREGFVSPCTAKCLKCLQDRKLVLLCVQNEKTEFTQVAMTAAEDFKADARYAKATEIVALDPEDRAETAFLQDLKIDPRTSQAVTVVLAPPGQPVASFVGAVTKDQIVAKVQAGPCAGGQCGPGGCCPK